jgi:hypothetical protein
MDLESTACVEYKCEKDNQNNICIALYIVVCGTRIRKEDRSFLVSLKLVPPPSLFRQIRQP